MDNTPQCVKDVLDKPGKYTFKHKYNYFYFYFEVTVEGEVYQLNRVTKERDGILEPEGWIPGTYDDAYVEVIE